MNIIIKEMFLLINFQLIKKKFRTLINFEIKCMNYYHVLGNDDKKQDSKLFNILICGPSGTCKSTFINQNLHQKLAKEGKDSWLQME